MKSNVTISYFDFSVILMPFKYFILLIIDNYR